jgi:hypothetical protein
MPPMNAPIAEMRFPLALIPVCIAEQRSLIRRKGQRNVATIALTRTRHSLVYANPSEIIGFILIGAFMGVLGALVVYALSTLFADWKEL